MSSAHAQEDDPLLEYVNEYLELVQRGGQPSIDEFCQRCAEQPDELRDLLEALDVLEELQPTSLSGSQAAADHLPETIGDYRIIGEIGRGGMGVVYEATQESLGRRVALKVLPTNQLNSESAQVRFQREARAAARMHHTNIVPVFDVGRDGDYFFYAMQLISGRGLDEIIDELRAVRDSRTTTPQSGISGAITIADGQNASATGDQLYESAAEITRQVADALAYAHDRNVIHRDIKPSNLLIDVHTVTWVTDFGLAKVLEDDVTLTQSGDYLGTLRYMSPERFRGECDARADIYALGMTLYELLTLQPAFAAANRIRLIYLINNTDPTAPRSIAREIPRDLETITLKCIDKDPNRRYQSAMEFADDLQRFLTDQPILARRLSLQEQAARWVKRNKSLAAAFGSIAALLIVIAVGALLFSIRQGQLLKQAELDSERATKAEQRSRRAFDDAVVARTEAESAQQRAEEAQSDAEEAQGQAEDREQRRRLRQYFAEANLAGQRLRRSITSSELMSFADRWAGDLPAQQRGWEWNFLRSLGQDPIQSVDVQDCRDVSWNPDDSQLVCCRTENVAFIYQVDGSKKLLTLEGHTDRIEAVSWHPSRPIIATVSRDRSLRLWDAQSGRCVQTVAVEYPAKQVAWNSTGDRLACATTSWQGQPKSRVRIFDSSNLNDADLESTEPPLDEDVCNELETISDFDANQRLLFSPDGSQLAAVMARGPYKLDQQIVVWDVESKNVTRKPFAASTVIWKESGNGIKAFAVSPAPGLLEVRNGDSSELLWRSNGHSRYIVSYAVSPDGSQLLTGGFDKTTRVWNLATGDQERIVQDHEGGVMCVRWNRSGQKISAGGFGTPLLLCDAAETFRRTKSFIDSSAAAQRSEIQVSWSSDNVQLACISTHDLSMHIYDTQADSIQTRTKRNYHSRCAWNPVLPGVVFAGDILRGWDVADAKNGPRGGDAAIDIAWHPEGIRYAATTRSRDGSNFFVRIFTRESGQLETEIPFDTNLIAIAWNPADTDALAVGCKDGRILMVDLQTKQVKLTIAAHDRQVNSLTWNASGDRLASSSDDGTAKIWRIDSAMNAECEHILAGHRNIVHQTDWHPSGRRLATAGSDSSVKIWDTATGIEILSLDDHSSTVCSVDWSPDGNKLAAGNITGRVIIWEAQP